MSPRKPKIAATDVDIRALAQDAALTSISFFELSAARFEDDGELEAVTSGDDNDEEPGIPEQYLNVARSEDGDGFRVRVKTVIDWRGGRIAVDVASEYSLDDLRSEQVSSALMLEYVNEVAIMHIIPYLRQGIADVSQRIWGEPLLLPVLQRGEMTFSEEQRIDSSEVPKPGALTL